MTTKVFFDTTWVTPHTFVGGELVTSTTMNGMRDNLNALKSPAYGYSLADESADYTTTSTSFVDVDGAGTAFELTITTAGGGVMVGFSGGVTTNGANAFFFNVMVDGADHIPDDGLTVGLQGTTFGPVGWTYLITGLAAGVHVFKLRWKVSGGTGTLWVGAGTASRDIHPQFWVMEIM